MIVTVTSVKHLYSTLAPVYNIIASLWEALLTIVHLIWLPVRKQILLPFLRCTLHHAWSIYKAMKQFAAVNVHKFFVQKHTLSKECLWKFWTMAVHQSLHMTSRQKLYSGMKVFSTNTATDANACIIIHWGSGQLEPCVMNIVPNYAITVYPRSLHKL